MRSTVMYCTEETSHQGEKYFFHFFSCVIAVEMCKSEGPIFQVTVSETVETPDCYWGWWDEKELEFCFVYPKKFMVEMCFPYGVKIEEERGEGCLLPVSVKVFTI